MNRADKITALEVVFRGLYRTLRREAGTALGRAGLTNGDFLFLRAVAQNRGVRASDVARELGVRRGYVTALSTRMMKKNLLKKSPSRSDGRTATLELTADGRKLFRRADNQVRGVLRTRLLNLKEQEVATLLDLLKKIEPQYPEKQS